MTEVLDTATAAVIRRRVTFRLATLFLLLQLMNAIDRSNVSFAAAKMNADLGFDARIYGFGISCFFLSYMLFQFPAIFLMRRLGPSKTLGLIVVSWGVVSMLMATIQGQYSFYGLRFLLGATEAGAVPVMLYYASCWTPQRDQGALFKISTLSWPLAVIIGAPLASLLMNHLDQAGGVVGWRWLFVAEGLPTVALGIFVLVRLVDRPSQARGLSPAERRWLVEQLDRDEAIARTETVPAGQRGALQSAFTDGRAWLLALIYFGEISGLYGCVFWLPQIIAKLSSGIGGDLATWLSIIPFAVGTCALLLNATHSDRVQERSGHLIAGFLVGGGGLLAAGMISDPWLAFAGLTVGIAGLCAATGIFWSIPTGIFRGSATAAAVFTLINLTGNLSGLIIPPVIGTLRVMTDGFGAALVLLSLLLFLSALLVRAVGEPAR